MTDRGLDQRSLYQEVLTVKQLALVGQCHDFGEKALEHGVFEQAAAVLNEAGVVSDLVAAGQPDEPAVKQVVAHLLHQLRTGKKTFMHMARGSFSRGMKLDRLRRELC